MIFFRIGLAVFLLIGFSVSLSGEIIEHETSIGAEFAYYFDNNSGYGQKGGFISPSYNPVETPAGFIPAAGDYSSSEPFDGHPYAHHLLRVR